jgi:hypothetical protein
MTSDLNPYLAGIVEDMKQRGATLEISAARMHGAARSVFDIAGLKGLDVVLADIRKRFEILEPQWERWTPQRKIDALNAMDRGDLTYEHAQNVLGISREEIDGWRDRYARFGINGLAVGRLQAVRG